VAPGDPPGVAILYALAVADSGLGRRLERHFLQVPDGCGIAAQEPPPGWTEQLDLMLASRPGAVDWRARRIRVGQ